MRFEYILWCIDLETNTDKVWGIIKIKSGDDDPDTFVTVWGRRGKKLQTKIWKGHDWDAEQQYCKKLAKGYTNVINYEVLYPEFEEDLKKVAVWSILKS